MVFVFRLDESQPKGKFNLLLHKVQLRDRLRINQQQEFSSANSTSQRTSSQAISEVQWLALCQASLSGIVRA
jgi:hypothetical protein